MSVHINEIEAVEEHIVESFVKIFLRIGRGETTTALSKDEMEAIGVFAERRGISAEAGAKLVREADARAYELLTEALEPAHVTH